MTSISFNPKIAAIAPLSLGTAFCINSALFLTICNPLSNVNTFAATKAENSPRLWPAAKDG